MLYAEIIVDISTQALDRIFTYKIPEELEQTISVGCQVAIPFGQGNRERKGYVMRIKPTPDYDPSKIKSIIRVTGDATKAEGQLLALAAWIKQQYGGTLIQALMTVLPLKAKIAQRETKYIKLNVDNEQGQLLLEQYTKKHYVAKVRLLQALLEDHEIEKSILVKTLNVAESTIKALLRDQIISENAVRSYRQSVSVKQGLLPVHTLNEEQQKAFLTFQHDIEKQISKTYLLYGVTGSGKTEVYLEMISEIIKQGKEAIVLIPEISLTYQTVRRFANRFGELVTVIHSKLSKGERYDQLERAKKGEVKIVIGPRSALFVPFSNLGLIIIDEEHETSYKSETAPKYHARETAIERARLCGASVVLGSATPSVESYERAKNHEYELLEMKQRANGAQLANTSVVDMRKELEAHNYSMFSRELQQALQERLNKKEQSILFINRRGYASFVSCRKCGYVVKCPHCDVALKLHGTKRLVCHYCGYETTLPTLCPECQSNYIRAFGTGTEKVEEQLNKAFPNATVLRMDADTTKNKGDYEKILSAFANEEADILVGTQMIVKGHDFPKVTLVAALAADMSLFEHDFRSSERTFDLLTQAAGRAGRGALRGNMIIQTYKPEEYPIVSAANQDYEIFYKQETAFRKMLNYPPYAHMLAVFMASGGQQQVEKDADCIAEVVKKYISTLTSDRIQIIGPSEATIYRIQDTYRRLLYIKCKKYDTLVQIKNKIEEYINSDAFNYRTKVFFDFDPMRMY